MGAMALSPKRGQPVKVMPLVAKTPEAFFSLLEELPKLVRDFSHKLYIHISPTVEQASILQGLGWKIESIMPSSYKEGIITQQWGKILTNMATMRIKNQYLRSIKSGEKDIEVRVGYDSVKRIKADEKIEFITYNGSIMRTVEEVKIYSSFEDLLDNLDPGRIVPGNTKSGVLSILREIYSSEKEKLGVYAFILKKY